MARLEVRAALGVLVLQEVFVATLAKLHLRHLAALLAEHDVFFLVAFGGTLGAVEALEDFPAIADLTLGGSFEGGGHGAKATGFRVGMQGVFRIWSGWGRARVYARTRTRPPPRPPVSS